MNRVASIAGWALVVAIILGTGALYAFARIDRVVFEGSVSEKRIVSEIVTRNPFRIDTAAIARSLEDELRWAREVRVRYRWPDTIEVSIDREAIAARWRGDAFVTAGGKIIRDFAGAEQPNVMGLAVLDAPDQDARKAVEVYRSIRDLAQPVTGISRVTAQKHGDWLIALDSGLEVIVHQDSMREEFGRFLAVFDHHLKDVVGRIALVDARYDSGVAVRWKSGAEEILAKNAPSNGEKL